VQEVRVREDKQLMAVLVAAAVGILLPFWL
jgi:hypothetical protein